MAGVKAPLMSLDASGTIGKAFTFSRWKGRSYVRRHAIPSNPRSIGQVSTRAVFQYLTQVWAFLGPTLQAYWENLASADNVTGLNALVRACMSEWSLYGKMTVDPTLITSGGPEVPDTLTQSALPRGVQLGFTENESIDLTEYYLIEIKPSSITAHEPVYTRVVVPKQESDYVHSVTVTKLEPGITYDWGIVACDNKGQQAAFVAGGTFIPTT